MAGEVTREPNRAQLAREREDHARLRLAEQKLAVSSFLLRQLRALERHLVTVHDEAAADVAWIESRRQP